MAPPTHPLLDGVTVLDLASVGPAARASRILADYGARVIKVAPTSKKGGLQIQPPFHSYGAGRGQRRVRIDLKAPSGRDALLRLAEKADVVIESFRPGVAARLGLGYSDLQAKNAGIVYCSTSGYGQDGPCAGWAGHDINYLAMAGFLACTEPRADGGPPVPGATVADSAGGGMHAALAIMAALVRRGTSGEGCYLDVSAAEGVLSLMALAIDQYLATGEVAGPRQTLLTGRYACYDLYRCRDDKWLSVGAIEARFFANLCQALGLEAHAAHQMEDDRQEQIRADFRQTFLKKDRDEWVRELAPKDTCVAPVHTIPELVEEPHWRERAVFMRAEHPEQGGFDQIAPVLAGGVRQQPLHRVRPPDQTDTDDVLAEAGLAPHEIEALRAEGAVE